MEWVVALVGALVGGGGIAGMLVVIFSYRKYKADGDKVRL